MADTSTAHRPAASRSSNPRDPDCNGGEPNGHDGKRVPPNPCGGKPQDGQDDCDCHKGNGAAPSPDEPKKPRPPKREDTCCEQLIDILTRTPGRSMSQRGERERTTDLHVLRVNVEVLREEEPEPGRVEVGAGADDAVDREP